MNESGVNPENFTAQALEADKARLAEENETIITPEAQQRPISRRILKIFGSLGRGFAEGMPNTPQGYIPKYPNYRNLIEDPDK